MFSISRFAIFVSRLHSGVLGELMFVALRSTSSLAK